MEALLVRQQEIVEGIQKIDVNFGKDSPSRKTRKYLDDRLDSLDRLWAEFQSNNDKLLAYEHEEGPYFDEDQFQKARTYFNSIRLKIGSFKTESHKEEWRKIKTQIEDVKQQEQASLSIHDVHQYSLLYSMLGVALITTCAYGLVRLRRKLNAARAATVNSPTQMTAAQEEEPMGKSRAKPTSPSATRSKSIRLDIPNDNSAQQ